MPAVSAVPAQFPTTQELWYEFFVGNGADSIKSEADASANLPGSGKVAATEVAMRP